MFGTRWRLFRLMGIPISLDLSWIFILLLLTVSFRSEFPQFMHHFYPEAGIRLVPADYWLMGLIAALSFFICIVLHELGHAVVARSRGMPIRGITLFLFGGVAELGDEPTSAGTEFLMAIAGPLVSLVLAAIFVGLGVAGYHSGWSPPLVLVLGYLGVVNGTVLLFNLVPAFPLDGGRVLRSILWAVTGRVREATFWASRIGQAFAWLLIAAGIFCFVIGLEVPRESGLIWSGAWLGFIGLFLNSAARSGYQQILIRQALQGEPVSRFMNPEPIVVPPTLDLRHWVEEYVYRYHRKGFPVAENSHLEGFISTQALSRVPRDEWDNHTVGEVMRQDTRAITIPPQADAMQALSKMQATGSSRLLVTEGDRLLGIVSLKDLLRFLNLKLHLENGNGSQPGPWTNENGTDQERSVRS
jgi:Zn-dependent protease/CBS domain-containing protein